MTAFALIIITASWTMQQRCCKNLLVPNDPDALSLVVPGDILLDFFCSSFSVLVIFIFYFFFYLRFMACQDYFTHFEPSQSLGGRKQELPDKKTKLTSRNVM